MMKERINFNIDFLKYEGVEAIMKMINSLEKRLEGKLEVCNQGLSRCHNGRLK